MGTMPDEMRTERLILRRTTTGDLPDLIDICADPATNRFTRSGIRDAEKVTREVHGYVEHWREHGFGYWTVLEAATGATIGSGGVTRRLLDGEPALNLYYRFRPSAWGKGYALEMARAAAEWARRERPAEPIVVITAPDNEPAIRLAVRLGLTQDIDVDLGHGPLACYRDYGGSHGDHAGHHGDRTAAAAPHH
ncbi:N-acetyltransferase [Pseudonocardiaceae bacterium YIM PH 21723]|nr:N-acetyltransferase [Pseudonocardiaceae bacterium YIM PH 21723]